MSDKILREAIDESLCPLCKGKTITLIKLTSRGTLTMNETSVCQNKNCPMYINIEGIRTWEKKSPTRYKRDFKTQNQEKFYINNSSRCREYILNH